jgi:hypothetical protein
VRQLGLSRVDVVWESNNSFVVASNDGCHHADNTIQLRVGNENPVEDIGTSRCLSNNLRQPNQIIVG